MEESERKSEKWRVPFYSLVWPRRFLLADENRLSPAVLRRGCTENEIALGSVCIIFRAYRSPGSRFFSRIKRILSPLSSEFSRWHHPSCMVTGTYRK